MKLSVVIVNYNVKYYLEQCLLSLRKATIGIDAEVYVVDNHSSDESENYIRDKFPEVRFIASDHNLGFARANNLAIRQSKGEYVLLLNPDTILAEQTLRQAISFLDEHEKAGALGVCQLKTDGSPANESRRGLPTPMTAFYKMVGLCERYPQSHRFAHYYLSYLPWNVSSQIEVISGACFFVKRRVFEQIGLVDEDFFMYGEDIDLSYRILKAGYQNWYIPSRILHYKGESTQKSSFRYVHVFYQAMLIFIRKHYGHKSLLFSIPIKLAIYFKASVTLVKIQLERIRKMLGFSPRKASFTPYYIFIGSNESIMTCKEIATKHALGAEFHVGDAESLPRGHQSLVVPTDRLVYIVYDVGAYSYENIFDIFGEKTSPLVHMGTFDARTRLVITGEEVLK
ncbi:MAG: glycosyltransferase family 2 protein [Prevotella sp.]|nr:glycosyltransferase family 2 protein [Prevotella sp.]